MLVRTHPGVELLGGPRRTAAERNEGDGRHDDPDEGTLTLTSIAEILDR